MTTYTITREQLARIIAHVEFASKDKTLPVLNGVHIAAEGDKITVSSTDRYALAESTLEVDSNDGETVSAIIPSADITNWKQTAKLSQQFRLTIESDKWELDAHGNKASGRTVTGDYPAVANLFPEDRQLHPSHPPDYLSPT